MRLTYEDTLYSLVSNNENIIVMTAENRAPIRNLPNKIGKKFIDVGIAEQTMIGMAAGLALRGNTVFTHALATFLTMRAFEFIRTDVGIANLPVIMTGFIPGILSEANGPTHQAIEDIGLMRLIPNVHIFSPVDEQDMVNALPELVESRVPWYIRYTNRPSIIEKHSDFKVGKSEEFGSGNDIAILTHGYLFNETMAAAENLENQGYDVCVVNMRTLHPIDEDVIIRHALNSDVLCVVEDHFVKGGLFTIVSEVLTAKNIAVKVIPIGFNYWYKPTLIKPLLEHEGLTGEAITKRILDLL